MESMVIDHAFWHNRRVLLTGHSGFKGAWLTIWLNRLGAKITGISLPPDTFPNLFELAGIDKCCTSHFCDIRTVDRLAGLIEAAQPEIVFHLAAQPLVRRSYQQPLETLATNVMGTANVLNALRELAGVRVVIVITTDKVYRNNEWPYPYREDDSLGGHDPYSASKAACEIVTASYRDAFFASQGIAVATCRAGNVIGGGDWAEDRLIPDAIRAWQAGEALKIRYSKAIRPWQHVLEPLNGYLTLARRLWLQPELAGAYNFGPMTHQATSVGTISEMALRAYGRGEIIHETSDDLLHETGQLTLETAKAAKILGLLPVWTLSETVDRTIAWYRAFHAEQDAFSLCMRDIEDYSSRIA